MAFRWRNRPAYSDDELRDLYSEPHDHTIFSDHIVRVRDTIGFINSFMQDKTQYSVADLSCGDAAVVNGLVGASVKYLGDYASGYQFVGPIEETINNIAYVDLFVCCETLEHLDDPDKVLRQIGQHAGRLVISTPLMTCADSNPEHYWSWDDRAVGKMLRRAKWKPKLYKESSSDVGYIYQIWGCAK